MSYKTPEELAAEYGEAVSKSWYISAEGERKWYPNGRDRHAKEDFLAGYQAAKDEYEKEKS